MDREPLYYQNHPNVTFASNTFVGVPTILQYEDTPLIEVVRNTVLGYHSRVSVYDESGVKIAVVNGTRPYPTKEGGQAGVQVSHRSDCWICTRNGGKETLFEIYQGQGDSFRMYAELFTPTGALLKYRNEEMPSIISATKLGLMVGSSALVGNRISGCRIGVLVKADGSVAICCR